MTPEGACDWIWDDDDQAHHPCCSQLLEREGFKCGNGPLTGEAIVTGDCGIDHSQPYLFHKGLTPQQRHQMFRMAEEMKERPWHSPLLLGRRHKQAERVITQKSIIYTRILRVRWGNRLFDSSARIWLGNLEIVLSAIPKKDWKQRKK